MVWSKACHEENAEAMKIAGLMGFHLFMLVIGIALGGDFRK